MEGIYSLAETRSIIFSAVILVVSLSIAYPAISYFQWKNRYFFNNLGYSYFSIYRIFGAINLLTFLLLSVILSLILHATN